MTNDWYRQPPVLRMLLQFMGVPCGDVHLLQSDFCREPWLFELLERTLNEYSVIRGVQIQAEKGSGVARSIRNHELPFYLNYQNPALEICQSFWQKEVRLNNGTLVPSRILFYLDIEGYNKQHPEAVAFDQCAWFSLLEPSYQMIRYWLLRFGITTLGIKTGKGYNFVSQIPVNTQAYFRIMDIGGRVEESVLFRQHFPDRKRRRSVPEATEQAFRGIFRLSQFFMNEVMDYACAVSKVRIEVSDIGNSGIAFDNTQFVRHVDTCCLGIPGSLYLNFLLQQEHIGREIVQHTPLPIRLIRSRGEEEYFHSLPALIMTANNPSEALEHIHHQTGYIPDGSHGILLLIEAYERSPLRRLHKMLDEENFDPPHLWDRTYGNLSGIKVQYPNVAWMLDYPHPALKNPDALEVFINTLYDAGWSPKHIVGMLVYMYTKDYGWGNFFVKHDPVRHAMGWVSIILGRRFR